MKLLKIVPGLRRNEALVTSLIFLFKGLLEPGVGKFQE